MAEVLVKPPRGLGRHGKALWREVTAVYVVDEPHHVALLEAACLASDRMHEAGDLVRKHGVILFDAKGSPRANPAVVAERDARLGLTRCLRELNLDGVAVESSARPPLIAGGHRYQSRGA